MKSDLKLNSLSIDLRKKWGVGIYEPLDIFPVVLSNFPNLSILNHVDELGGLTDGKKRELLLDGGRADLVFNKKSNLNDSYTTFY